MKLLIDSHLILWASQNSKLVTAKARSMMLDPENTRAFSAASIWELAIKQNLNRPRFPFDIAKLRDQLIENDYEEVPVTSLHGLCAASLPPLHKDPFDRLLIAQALCENMLLLTADDLLARYAAPVMKI